MAVEEPQTAPKKPHPAMVQQAVNETGVQVADAIVIGDTSYDMAMARAAGAGAVGVSWGYHEPDQLVQHGAHEVIGRFIDLPGVLSMLWEQGW